MDQREPDVGERLDDAGPRDTSTRAPAGSDKPSSAPAETAVVNTSAGSAATPAWASLATTSATTMLGLLDRKPIRRPAARSIATAPAAEGIGVSPRQMTPSRSRQTTGGFTRPPHAVAFTGVRSFGLGDHALEHVPVVGLIGAHGHRELEVATGTEPVPLAEQAQTEPEVGVVVDGVDLHRLGELGRRRREPAAAEIGAGERLADRALVGLQIAAGLSATTAACGFSDCRSRVPS